jgi:riboflavin synthase
MMIGVKNLPLVVTSLGASIACSGICLTVIEKTSDSFTVQLSTETLSKTTVINWQEGRHINLEPALRFGDELGGHMLTGHVDGVAYLVDKEKVGDSFCITIDAPDEYTRFLAPKGSVAIDGISLTVNEVRGHHFTVNIIPHTQNYTTLSKSEIGQDLNLEVDMIARYVERIVNHK